jgi:predicted aldo/keto reductase-like oxidoreductase
MAGLAGLTVLNSDLKAAALIRLEDNKNKFIFRTLGKTGYKLPVISMGVMNADNPNLVQAALDAGIVLLDTAHMYQQGRNEEMVGQVIKSRPRESFVIATKMPAEGRDPRTGIFTGKETAEAFIKRYQTSVKRLGLDYLDILCVHSISRRESALFEPILEALAKLKKEGKTRFVGITTHKNEPDVIRAAIDSRFYDVVLTAYNFRQPHVEEVKKTIAQAAQAGLGIIAMKTQAGVYWDRERKSQINMKAALKWVLQDENVHTAIPGFTTFDQMDLDLSVMENLELTPEEEADLKIGISERLSGLYCAQCEKCVPQCRVGLDIPAIMRSYMYAYGYRSLAKAKEALQHIDLSLSPCRSCENCVVQCSMGFDVRDRILDIARINDVPDDFLV